MTGEIPSVINPDNFQWLATALFYFAPTILRTATKKLKSSISVPSFKVKRERKERPSIWRKIHEREAKRLGISVEQLLNIKAQETAENTAELYTWDKDS